MELAAQDEVGVLEDALHQGDEVQGVGGRVHIEEGQRVQQVEAQRLVHAEVRLQIGVHPQLAAVFVGWLELDDAAHHQRLEKLPAPAEVGGLLVLGLVAVVDEVAHGLAAVALAAEHVQQHAVVCWKRLTRRSGAAACSFSKVVLSQWA